MSKYIIELSNGLKQYFENRYNLNSVIPQKYVDEMIDAIHNCCAANEIPYEFNSSILSAKRAFEKSKSIKEFEFTKEVDTIFEEINKSISIGDTDLTLDHNISDRATKFLENLGYKVNVETWTRETTEYTTNISWEDE